MDNQKSILFYLSTCPTCNRFRLECQKYNILKNFQEIKIDNNIEYYKQKGLVIVPTIKVIGYSKSFIGSECFEWLNSIISTINQQKNNSPINIPNKKNEQYNKITKPPLVEKNNETKNLNDMGYRPNEMNGISDTYAYKDIDTAFPMSFQSRNLNTEIYTPPIEKNKIEKSKQTELIKKMELVRNNDKNEFIKIAEQERNKVS
jgi:hypothetical protein